MISEIDRILSDFGCHGQCNAVPDEKIHRFKTEKDDHKQSGWIIAFQNHSIETGETFYVVVIGSWRTGDHETHCTFKGTLSKHDKKNRDEQIAKARAKHQAEVEAKHEEVAKATEAEWNNLPVPETHAYLTRKRIHRGASKDIRHAPPLLLVSVRDEAGKIWNYQKINEDGEKRFRFGGKVKDCFHQIGELGPIIYLCEGYATGESIYAAVKSGVIVCFNAANLVAVATRLVRLYPDKKFLVCGDDDTKDPNKNPGRISAEEAAKRCLGKAVFPLFREKRVEWSDWNDLHVQEGIEKVKEQIEKVVADLKEPDKIDALGHVDDSFFFTSTHNQGLIRISIGSFTKNHMKNLIHDDMWWESKFTNSKGIDWDAAATWLIKKGHEAHVFEPMIVRGAGVWRDEKRTIINAGNRLYVDGVETQFGKLQSEFLYIPGVKLNRLSLDPLSVDECQTLIDACDLFKWNNKESAMLLAGAMVTTRLCGALPIRPHIWIIGEKGSGKSTLLNRFVFPLMGKPCAFAAGNSTEAGIRQLMKANAYPVVFDEFENNGEKSQQIIQELIDLFRVAWSETAAGIVKGSASGVADMYHVRFSGIVSSVRQVSLSDADQSRFATMELAPHDGDNSHWPRLAMLLDKIDAEFGDRLFARAIQMIPVIMKNFHNLKKHLSRSECTQRFSDQYGMLLAGFSILMQDTALNEDECTLLLQHFPLNEAKESNALSDQESCLHHLMLAKVSIETEDADKHPGRTERMISELVKDARSKGIPDYDAHGALRRYGIKVSDECMYVLDSHPELAKRVFQGTRWHKSWSTTLARLPGASKTSVRLQIVSSNPLKCVKIPIK